MLAAGVMVSLSGCDRLEARDQLNKGVEAYKSAHYEEAIGHFQKATQLDPTLPMAKTYLGTALAGNVVPGLDTPENIKTADQAIGIFNEVLQKDPNDVNSIKQIASLYFNIKQLDKARDWQKKVLAVDPKDPEAAYTVGVIDWTEAHENVLKAFDAAGGSLSDDGKGNVKAPKKVLQQISEENKPLTDESLQYLQMAISNRENYDDAMSYMNLVYRRKADVDYADAAAVKADVTAADDWAQKAMGARKINQEKKNSANTGGVTMDANGNLK